jgi:hypothetical protein
MSHDSRNPGVVIKLRRDTTTNWSTDNPVLAEGETGWDTDLLRVKLGDGVTAWNDLPYAVDPGASTQGVFVSTDASFGLPAPSGVGGEFVIAGDVLDDITYNGVSL